MRQVSQKIIPKTKLAQFCNRIHKSRKKIVFTNGVFDILHAGHVEYLVKAHRLGDILIVGLNTDASVKENKGDKRPIISYQERAKLLAALEFVDYIVPLERKTPDRLIPMIDPHVLVKGSQYKINEIVGADHVLSKGGKVVRMPMVKGLSTSEIIRRIKAAY